MSKERYNQIIDEVYNEYAKSFENQSIVEQHSFDTDPITKEMFIEKIKFFGEFSERWGLKIEERELSWEERNEWSWENWGITCEMESVLDEQEVPKRVITLEYNGEKIEVYE